jgi:ABC-type transport system involved in multi-copper enzyme maturation permease subunit
LVLLAVSAIGQALTMIHPPWGWTFQTFPQAVETGLAIASLAHPASPIFISGRSAMGFPTLVSDATLMMLHTAIHLSLATIFVLWATLRLRSAYRFEPAPIKTKIAQNARKFRERFTWGRPAVWDNSPHIWKEVYAVKLKRFGWLLTIFFVLGVLYYYGTFLQEWWRFFEGGYNVSNETLGIMASVCSIAWVGLGYLMVAFRSASSIGEEKDRDCWISLLSTPITAREMIVSKVIGSFLTITPYVVVQMPILLYCAATTDLGILRLGYWLISVIVFGMAVASLGVYQSLVQSSTGRAIGMTLFISAIFSGLGQIFMILPMMGAPELGKLVLASLPWTPLGMSFIGEQIDSEFAEIAIMTVVYMVIISFGASILVASSIDRFPKISERIEE